MVALMRMSPLIPYNFFNYTMAVTSVRARDFISGSIGMVPMIGMYVYIGVNINSL